MAQCYESRLQINCPVFSLTSHSHVSLLPSTLHTNNEARACRGIGKVSFHVYCKSFIGCTFLNLFAFLVNISRLLFFFQNFIMHIAPFFIFFAFIRLFLLALIFLYSIISGKNRTWKHVLSLPF